MFFCFSSQAQVKHGVHKNLAKYFEKEEWEDLAFKAERMLIKQQHTNDPEIYLYLGYSYNEIFLLCLEKPELLNKYPEYLTSYKNALNYSQQAKKKDKKKKLLFPDNDKLLQEIAITGYYYIDDFVTAKKKYPKANSQMNKILKTYSDNNLIFMKGVLCEMSNDLVNSKAIFDTVFDKLSTSNKEKTAFYTIEAFDYYIHFLIDKEEPEIEKAKTFINKGIEIYPDNEMLIYLSEYIENPQTQTSKPENKLKKEILKQLKLNITDNDEDDDERD